MNCNCGRRTKHKTEYIDASGRKVKKHTLKTIRLVLQGIWEQSAEEEPNKER